MLTLQSTALSICLRLSRTRAGTPYLASVTGAMPNLLLGVGLRRGRPNRGEGPCTFSCTFLVRTMARLSGSFTPPLPNELPHGASAAAVPQWC